MGKKEKLTQAQKSYLIKRIDEITAQKMSEVCNTVVTVSQVRSVDRYYQPVHSSRTVSDNTLDKESLAGIASGKIKLLTKKDVIAHMKSRLITHSGVNYVVTGISSADFIDQDSLGAFNKERNVKAVKTKKEAEAKMSAIRKTAAGLKDEVMLEGDLAIGVLEKFEKKVF